jgi:hypothetical protein
MAQGESANRPNQQFDNINNTAAVAIANAAGTVDPKYSPASGPAKTVLPNVPLGTVGS